jgi:hypothetical protein
MVGMSLGIVMMGAIVAARLPADLARDTADPEGFAAGVGSGLTVNAALALIAAVLAVAMIRGRRVSSFGGRRPGRRRSGTMLAADSDVPRFLGPKVPASKGLSAGVAPPGPA